MWTPLCTVLSTARAARAARAGGGQVLYLVLPTRVAGSRQWPAWLAAASLAAAALCLATVPVDYRRLQEDDAAASAEFYNSDTANDGGGGDSGGGDSGGGDSGGGDSGGGAPLSATDVDSDATGLGRPALAGDFGRRRSTKAAPTASVFDRCGCM